MEDILGDAIRFSNPAFYYDYTKSPEMIRQLMAAVIYGSELKLDAKDLLGNYSAAQLTYLIANGACYLDHDNVAQVLRTLDDQASGSENPGIMPETEENLKMVLRLCDISRYEQYNHSPYPDRALAGAQKTFMSIGELIDYDRLFSAQISKDFSEEDQHKQRMAFVYMLAFGAGFFSEEGVKKLYVICKEAQDHEALTSIRASHPTLFD